MMKNSDLFWASKDSEEEMDNAASESDENLVYRDQNRIYFYSEVKRSKILVLNKLLRKLDKDLVNRANYLDTVTPNIYLHVQSFGGSVFSAFSNIDYIQSSHTCLFTNCLVELGENTRKSKIQ